MFLLLTFSIFIPFGFDVNAFESVVNGDDLDRKIERLNEMLLKQQVEINNQKAQIEGQQLELKNHRNQIKILSTEVAKCECKTTADLYDSDTNRNRRLLLGDNGQTTAFYAHLSKNIDSLGNHQSIIFDTVRFNQGGGYNSGDGEFRASLPGTYFFIWTISNADQTYMQSEIVKNGVVFGQIISDSGNHNDWAVSTSFAIMQLEADDRVWIRSGTVHSGHVNGQGFGTSSFAGFLLR